MQNPTPLFADPALDTDDLSAAAQQRLSGWNHVRLDPTAPTVDWELVLTDEMEMRRLEGRFVEAQRRSIAARAEQAPSDVAGFIAWFEDQGNRAGAE